METIAPLPVGPISVIDYRLKIVAGQFKDSVMISASFVFYHIIIFELSVVFKRLLFLIIIYYVAFTIPLMLNYFAIKTCILQDCQFVQYTRSWVSTIFFSVYFRGLPHGFLKTYIRKLCAAFLCFKAILFHFFAIINFLFVAEFPLIEITFAVPVRKRV